MVTQVSIKEIYAFRKETGFSLADCKEAMMATGGNKKKAHEYIINKWASKMEKS